jgi:hypothetical protein
MLASMSKATKAVLASVGSGQVVTAFHALVSARTPLTMTGTLNQASRSQQAAAGQGPMSTFKADTAFKARPPRSPRPCSVISTGLDKNLCYNVHCHTFVLLQRDSCMLNLSRKFVSF